jgi:hypothetical protein
VNNKEPEMKSILCAVFAGLILMGCAAQRPQLPDDQYFGFARTWHTIGWCAYKGWMDPATAASGKSYVSATINKYSFDRERLAQEDKSSVIAQSLNELTEGDCRNIAVSIQTRKQQIDNQNATTAMQQQAAQEMINSTKSTQTYCNKIGTQVLCNSY